MTTKGILGKLGKDTTQQQSRFSNYEHLNTWKTRWDERIKRSDRICAANCMADSCRSPEEHGELYDNKYSPRDKRNPKFWMEDGLID